ncbi:MAG: hypothetical protein ACI9LT_002769 [Pseudoalteromonas distincta]|jgi:hypothetical protein
MNAMVRPLYCPALRMKAGELQGLRALAADIADCTLPRMIVPPPKERDDSLQAALFETEAFPDVSVPLAASWHGREVLVEPTYIMDEFGRDRISRWLPRMFERARTANVQATPLVRLADFLDLGTSTFLSTVDHRSRLKFSIAVSSGDLDDIEALRSATGILEQLGLSEQDCAIVVDFHDADLTDHTLVSPVISGALEAIQAVAPWRHIVFQGTNFPEKNPAEPGSYSMVPRNEWLAWRDAVSFDPETADYLMFGDYAADCAKISFGGSGGRAICHYRYTVAEGWLVQRAVDTGRNEDRMRTVCTGILESGHFAGRDFSSADEYIYNTAHRRAGPGTAMDWRAINTTHHITRVVKDVGAVRGRRFAERAVAPHLVQTELF